MDFFSDFTCEKNISPSTKTELDSNEFHLAAGSIKEEIVEYQLPCKAESPWPENEELIKDSIIHFKCEKTECKIEPNIGNSIEENEEFLSENGSHLEFESLSDFEGSLNTEQKILSEIDSNSETQDFCKKEFHSINDFYIFQNTSGSTDFMKNCIESLKEESLPRGSKTAEPKGFVRKKTYVEEDSNKTKVSSGNLSISKQNLQDKTR